MKEHIKEFEEFLAWAYEPSEPNYLSESAVRAALALMKGVQPENEEQEAKLCNYLAEQILEAGQADFAAQLIRTTRLESRATGWNMRGQNSELAEEVARLRSEVNQLTVALGGEPDGIHPMATNASTDLEYWQRKSRDNWDSLQGCYEELQDVKAERDRLVAERDTPHISSFLDAVRLEALHQRERWGVEHDAGKADADWFWLVGYLAGKALTACGKGDREKALHHTISTAAALMNWHAALSGADTRMRPGIDAEAKGVGE